MRRVGGWNQRAQNLVAEDFPQLFLELIVVLAKLWRNGAKLQLSRLQFCLALDMGAF